MLLWSMSCVHFLSSFFLSSHLYPMDLIITILPVFTKDLSISPWFTPYNFLSRCKFSTLTIRQPMVEFCLLTFPRFPLRKKEHNSYFGKNRTHDFRTSRCAGYLPDHSGGKSQPIELFMVQQSCWLQFYASCLVIFRCNHSSLKEKKN